jgi:hypothetical protein
MGDLRVDTEEMLNATTNRMRREPCGAPMRQVTEIEPEQEKEGTGKERTVHVLSEACRRAGVLRPRGPDEAPVPAARVWRKARHRSS